MLCLTNVPTTWLHLLLLDMYFSQQFLAECTIQMACDLNYVSHTLISLVWTEALASAFEFYKQNVMRVYRLGDCYNEIKLKHSLLV